MTYERISELIDENTELKARIADLEWELMLHQTGWANAPKEAMWRATEPDGYTRWFRNKPHFLTAPKGWLSDGSGVWFYAVLDKPADFTQTLEPRPVREAKS